MRTLRLLAGICALALATPTSTNAEKDLFEKQMDVLRLFKFVNQPSYYEDFIQIAKEFKFEGHFDQWTKPQYAKEFYDYYRHGILPQGHIFSVFYSEHRKQAITLFRTFYYAKDYETFFKAAVWARQNINAGMFVYALSVAIVHNKFTKGIVLPPIYEIFPQYFFNYKVISKAQQYKQIYERKNKDAAYNNCTIQANYSEHSMSYYREDVGVNSAYFYQHIMAPFWMPREELLYMYEIRGRYFINYHLQLLARYYAERLSNELGEITVFEYNKPIEIGYNPLLIYPNELLFPTRPNQSDLSSPILNNVISYEERLIDAINNGFVVNSKGEEIAIGDENGLDILGLLIEDNADSPNSDYYGNLITIFRRLLGYSYYSSISDQYKIPSVMEHFETSLRDPMFYQMFKHIMNFVQEHQTTKRAYNRQELLWNKVTVMNFDISNLTTFFDYHYSDLTNSVTVKDEEDSFKVLACQLRLNHKPFSYKVHVLSQIAKKAFIKVFIGPKYDKYGRVIKIENNRMNFYEIDRFRYDLKFGRNVIERKSHESPYFANDLTSYQQLLAANKTGEFKYNSPFYNYAFPQRFMLPKGGKTYQIYIIVAEYKSHEKGEADDYIVDPTYPLGYPFDRSILSDRQFNVKNSLFKDVAVHHEKTEKELNTT